MNEDRYTRNEIIADDLDDRASRSTSDIRRRINREVVRVEEERPEESIDNEDDYFEDSDVEYDEDTLTEEEVDQEIEEEETNQVTFAEKYEDLRGKYVKAVMNSTFKDDGSHPGEDPKPKSLDECIKEVIDARKD